MTLCGSCSTENDPANRFCEECGGPLERSCPDCGAVLKPRAKFCGTCGTRVAPATTPPGSPISAPAAPAAPAAAPQEAPSVLADGRYEIARLLGEGGRKRVYLAQDTRLGREVALSLVKTEGLDQEGRARVQREAQAMARLGDHPNVVTVFDVGEDEGQLYFVSQYMAGGDLEGLLRQQPEHRLYLDEAVHVCDQIAAALEHAHANEIIHRDIKPGNIWLDGAEAIGDATAMLGDFGVAALLNRTRLTQEGMVVGTAAYMAPEQAVGRPVDGRSDLYALGCVLYEMVAGNPPFMGDDAVGVISQHLNTAPMAPSWHNQDVTTALEALIMDLLAKVPDDRPPDAAAVRERLAECLEGPRAPSAVGLLGSRVRRARGVEHVGFGRFIGREKEMATLKGGVDAALGGQGGIFMLAGEAGIGKTRLAEEASTYAQVCGATVLVGNCAEGETSLAYLPFVQAISRYVTQRPDDSLRQELGDGGSDVAKLVSEVRLRLPDLPESLPREPEQERYRLFESVSTFLLNAARTNPIVLVLEDLQWAGQPTLLLFQHLARQVPASRLLIIGTYRDADLGRQHRLLTVLADLRRERLYTRIHLSGLSVDELAALLDAAADHRLSGSPKDLARIIHRETEGNPFFAEEVIRHLAATEILVRDDGGNWVLKGEMTDLGIPEGVRAVIGERLSHLSKTCNAALSHAAVLGREFDFTVLQQMSDVEAETLLDSIEEALVADVLVERMQRGQPVYAFTHALVRETLYEELSLPRKQARHLQAAQAIETVYAANLTPHVGQLVQHHRFAGTAGDPAKMQEYALTAAQAAGQVYAWEAAIRHLQTALETMEAEETTSLSRAMVLEQLGGLMYVAGLDVDQGIDHYGDALRIYEAEGQLERAAQMHSRMTFMLAFNWEFMDIPRARRHVVAAEPMLADGPPRPAQVYFYIGRAAVELWSHDITAMLPLAQKAVDLAEELGDEALWGSAAPLLGWGTFWAGQPAEGLDLMERAWQALRRSHGAIASVMTSWEMGAALSLLWDPADAMEKTRREMDNPLLAEAHGMRNGLYDLMAHAAAYMGQVGEARRHLGEWDPDPADPEGYVHLIVALLEGEWESAEATSDILEAKHQFSGNLLIWWASQLFLGWNQYVRGDLEAAEGTWRANRNWCVERGIPGSEWWHCAALAPLYANQGRLDEARACAARAREIIGDGTGWRGAVAQVERAEGLVAAASGDLPAADRLLGSAVQGFSDYRVPWIEALTLQEWGRVLLEYGEPERAAEKFDATLDVLRRHEFGNRWFERVITDKLRAQGVNPDDVSSSIHAVLQSVQGRRHDFRSCAGATGVVTLMVSDIAGLQSLTERVGEEAARAVVEEYSAVVRQRLPAHNGTVVRVEGDGFLLAFGSPAEALQCAIAVQRDCAALHAEKREEAVAPTAQSGRPGSAAPQHEPVHARMGLDLGDSGQEADNFFSKTVILASRLAGQAEGEEIIVTAAVKAAVDESGEFTFDGGRELRLKGLSQPYTVHRVGWR